MADTPTLGNITHKPMQRDMFTGELTDKKPKSGNGSHVVLKSTGIERRGSNQGERR